MKELAARLKKSGKRDDEPLMLEAAERIEVLTAQVERLTRDIAALGQLGAGYVAEQRQRTVAAESDLRAAEDAVLLLRGNAGM